jgi:glycosyltransferase involved in cell wall biosynthesis
MLMNEVVRPIQVLGNFIDETRFTFAPESQPDGKFRVLTVTHEGWVKDSATFFQAIARVVKSGHDDVEAVIIGNVHYGNAALASSAALEKLAETSGVRSSCRFLPFVERAAMPSHYAACNVFVCTSITETFGVAPREAMAVGRPVISTANGGVEDILSSRNGIKVQIGDDEAIAEAIIAIKTGRAQFNPAEIRQEVVEKNGRAAFLRDMSQVYEETVGRS